MKNFILPLIFIASLFMAACSDDEPVAPDKIAGSWVLQYPEGLQTEGFIEWAFSATGQLEIRVYDVFSGDHTTGYDYTLSEEKKSIAISGNIKNEQGVMVHDTFAVYDVVKLTKKELRIRQTWVNTSYDNLDPEDKNSFLLGAYKDESFKRCK